MVAVLAGAGTLLCWRACCGALGPTSVTSTAADGGAFNFSVGRASNARRTIAKWAEAEISALRRRDGSIATVVQDFDGVGCCASRATLVNPPSVMVAMTRSMVP